MEMKCELYTTLFHGNNKDTEKEGIRKEELIEKYTFTSDNGQEDQVVNLYPKIKYQTIQGFGGALTDAAGYVYSLMNEEQKKEMLTNYFSEKEMGYHIARIHMDSCDFSTGHYEAMSDPEDLEMKSFDMSRTEKYIIPLLEDAQKICPEPIEIMLTPWSPPVFMKTNGERDHGGKLKEEYRSFWAEYICRYIEEFQKRNFKVTRISVQNEPKATQIWDSCVYTALEEKMFLRDYLYPAMKKHNLTDIEIFIWDHNKERAYERARDIIAADTEKIIAGVAFHWYSGDHFQALRLIQEQFPDKKLILSEACIEYAKYGKKDYLANAQKYAHDIIGNMNNGMEAFYDWNILLDEKGGPTHAKYYCDAPYLYHTKTGELIERNTLSYIRHFSHYIQPGARRIAHTSYTEEVEVIAVQNPDDIMVVVFLNRTREDKHVNLRLHKEMVRITIRAQGIATAVIR